MNQNILPPAFPTLSLFNLFSLCLFALFSLISIFTYACDSIVILFSLLLFLSLFLSFPVCLSFSFFLCFSVSLSFPLSLFSPSLSLFHFRSCFYIFFLSFFLSSSSLSLSLSSYKFLCLFFIILPHLLTIFLCRLQLIFCAVDKKFLGDETIKTTLSRYIYPVVKTVLRIRIQPDLHYLKGSGSGFAHVKMFGA